MKNLTETGKSIKFGKFEKVLLGNITKIKKTFGKCGNSYWTIEERFLKQGLFDIRWSATIPATIGFTPKRKHESKTSNNTAVSIAHAKVCIQTFVDNPAFFLDN